MKTILSVLALLGSMVFLSADDEEVLKRGKLLSQHFFDGELEELWNEFGTEMQGFLPLENLRVFHSQVGSQLGAEAELLEESVVEQGGATSYLRKARYEDFDGVIDLTITFDEKDKIAGFLIRPAPAAAPTEFLEYKTRADLYLPFQGEWDVFWGGRTIEQNYHVAYADQRFAYDIMVLKEGASYAGDPAKNESYHCFGLPLLAPGAGKVVVAVDGVEDNVPGEMNPRQAPGNHIVIDHGNDEFSLLAHFQKGTLAVKVGDVVTPETLLGKCGNSGNTSEPHLHFHLQNAPAFGRGKGLPAQFQDYLADDKPVERGEPVQGQRIRRRPPATSR